MLRDVEKDIAEVLEAAALGVSQAIQPPSLFAGPFPPSAPDRMVSCRFAGGAGSEEYLGGRSMLAPDVTVTIRGEANRYRETLELAQACFDELHLPTVGGYVMVKPDSPGPTYLGADEKGRHRFSFTVSCQYLATATPA